MVTSSPPAGKNNAALLTIAVLLLLSGFIWQVKATTLHGGSALVAYLLLVLISLGWQQQWAIGVYLAIGGGLVFACGLALSIYRDKLLEIPERLAQRENGYGDADLCSSGRRSSRRPGHHELF